MHVPAALLAERVGGKYIIVTAIFATAIISLVTPIAVTMGGATALIALRVVMGALQGGLFPGISTLMAAWIPVRQRGILSAVVFAGLPVYYI